MTTASHHLPRNAASRGNFFKDVPLGLSTELFETLLQNDNVRIERIISKGHMTPPGEWYDQDRDEWVLLLRGVARLSFDGDCAPLEMVAGDYVFIPAHCKHRVDWTDPQQESIWLAVHIASGG
jgi:cupin 2 domain-containing protein